VLTTYNFTLLRERIWLEFIVSTEVMFMNIVLSKRKMRDRLRTDYLSVLCVLVHKIFSHNKGKRSPNIWSVLKFYSYVFCDLTRERVRGRNENIVCFCVKVLIYLRQTERNKGQNIFPVLDFCTWILYVVTWERGKREKREDRRFCMRNVYRYMNFYVITREREKPEYIVSV